MLHLIAAALLLLASACQGASRDPRDSATAADEKSTGTSTSGDSMAVTAPSQWIDMLAGVIQQQRMTTLKPDCLSFEPDADSVLLSYTVREKHSAVCGGDLETAPRLFSIAIDTLTGVVRSDAKSGDGSMDVIRPRTLPSRP